MNIGDVSWGKLLTANKSGLPFVTLDIGPDVRWSRLFKAQSEEKSISGNIVSFTSKSAKPLKACTVDIRPAQEGSGNPSPENVRPITGWTDMKINVSPTYEARDGTIYSVTIPSEAGVVYGGTLDVINGTLTITHKLLTFDGSETWGIIDNPDNIRYYTITNIGDGHVIRSDIYSHTVYNQNLRTSQASTDVQYGARLYTTTTSGILRLIVCLPDMPDTKAGFQAMLASWATAGTPLQVCYELAEPVTYQLTPTQIMTQAGRNNVWTNFGTITVQVDKTDTNIVGVGAVAGIAIVGTADLRSGGSGSEGSLVGTAIVGQSTTN